MQVIVIGLLVATIVFFVKGAKSVKAKDTAKGFKHMQKAVGFFVVMVVIVGVLAVTRGDKQTEVQPIESTKATETAKKSTEPTPEQLGLAGITTPLYTVKAYKEGDSMPAANGNTMNCTQKKCYQVDFATVDGTSEAKELATKIKTSIKSTDNLPIYMVEYWVQSGNSVRKMLTAKFF
jgi:hypothetical protein